MCFTMDFWERVFFVIILLIGLWAIIKLFLPYLTSRLPPLVVNIMRILAWVFVALLCVIIIFGLAGCVWGLVSGLFGGGLSGTFYHR